VGDGRASAQKRCPWEKKKKADPIKNIEEESGDPMSGLVFFTHGLNKMKKG